ncbi:hypothetical protein Tco_0885161 [Tanacetum coccineum]
MELKTSSSFKTTGLLKPWKTLCNIFSKCLTTRVTGWDQPPLQIMQIMYCFVNNIHVDYAELLWEGLYYSLHHPTSSIPYPRFTKIIVIHYMTIFPDISRRARDKYHNLQDDDIMKNIFNSGRHKDKVGMQIPAWMITEEMKHTEHYQMYAEVFGIDVPLTLSQPTESTQGTYRTPSTPRSPNPNKEAAESSAPRRSTMIHLRIPERRSTPLTPPAPVPNVETFMYWGVITGGWVSGVVRELLGDGASWPTVVEEGESVNTAGTRAATSSIGETTSGAG